MTHLGVNFYQRYKKVVRLQHFVGSKVVVCAYRRKHLMISKIIKNFGNKIYFLLYEKISP